MYISSAWSYLFINSFELIFDSKINLSHLIYKGTPNLNILKKIVKILNKTFTMILFMTRQSIALEDHNSQG